VPPQPQGRCATAQRTSFAATASAATELATGTEPSVLVLLAVSPVDAMFDARTNCTFCDVTMGSRCESENAVSTRPNGPKPS
jgi:hypothetical protein